MGDRPTMGPTPQITITRDQRPGNIVYDGDYSLVLANLASLASVMEPPTQGRILAYESENRALPIAWVIPKRASEGPFDQTGLAFIRDGAGCMQIWIFSGRIAFGQAARGIHTGWRTNGVWQWLDMPLQNSGISSSSEAPLLVIDGPLALHLALALEANRRRFPGFRFAFAPP